jgi:hypothetical protein
MLKRYHDHGTTRTTRRAKTNNVLSFQRALVDSKLAEVMARYCTTRDLKTLLVTYKGVKGSMTHALEQRRKEDMEWERRTWYRTIQPRTKACWDPETHQQEWPGPEQEAFESKLIETHYKHLHTCESDCGEISATTSASTSMTVVGRKSLNSLKEANLLTAYMYYQVGIFLYFDKSRKRMRTEYTQNHERVLTELWCSGTVERVTCGCGFVFFTK